MPCPSIFERKKPLSENTLRRIARGIVKYVINSKEPYIVPVHPDGGAVAPHVVSIANWSGQSVRAGNAPLSTVTANPKGGHHALVCATIATNTTGHPGAPADEPLRTITTGGHHAVITPLLAQVGYGEAEGQQPRVNPPGKPLWTVVSGGNHAALVAALLDKRFTGTSGASVKKTMPTVTAKDHNQLVTTHIVKLRGSNVGHGADEPLHTLSAQGKHFGEVRALLVKYYGNEKHGADLFAPAPTVTGKDHLGLVTVHIKGEPYVITDIGMRMLQPKELYAAQGFPENYVYDHTAAGVISKAGQVRMCGNAVCPPLARALMRTNYKEASNETKHH